MSFYHFAHSWVLLDAPQSFEDFFQQFLDGDGRFSIMRLVKYNRERMQHKKTEYLLHKSVFVSICGGFSDLSLRKQT